MILGFLLDNHDLPAQNASRACAVDEHQRLAQENAMLREQLDRSRQHEGPGHTSSRQQPTAQDNFASTRPFVHGPTLAKSKNDESHYETEVHQYRQQHAEMLARYRSLIQQLNEQQIDSFEDLSRQDKRLMQLLMELVKLTDPMPMEGFNIGLFGITSTGKSTLLNAILGSQVAETGAGETTTKIKPYSTKDYVLWDVPGRNDEVSYFTMEYISFLKGLTKRFVLIQATVKENSSLMKLLDAAGLRYTIVVNKFDRIQEKDRDVFQNQVRREITEIGLQGVENLYFVSAIHPNMFPDWSKMLNDMQNSPFSLPH